jgi:hypothetical protein
MGDIFLDIDMKRTLWYRHSRRGEFGHQHASALPNEMGSLAPALCRASRNRPTATEMTLIKFSDNRC